MSLSADFPTTRPSLLLDFVNTQALDPRITFTRASSATYFDAAGVLQTAPAGQARFDYNPSTFAPLGLLIEEQRVNSLPNNTMQGVVAGNPGTAPTGWTVTGLSNSIVRTIVGTGTENGITYIDLNYAGTASGDGNITIISSSTTAITASTGQTWTGSVYLRLVGGSLSNLNTPQITLGGRSSAGSLLESTSVSLSSLTSAPLNSQRFIATRTLTNASTERVTITVFNATYVNGAAVDITLRIGLPQLELGAFATSVIPTTTTAVTRNADAASMTGVNFSSWFNNAEGTLYSESSVLSPSGTQKIVQADASAGFANSIDWYYSNSGFPRFDSFVNSALQWGLTPAGGAVTANTVTKLAGVYKVDDIAAVRNAGTVLTDTSALIPSVNRLLIGNANLITQFLNGHIRKLAYYPFRLTDSQLQALTS